jgi:TRAP transporter TAXI family solute receptor
VFAFPERFLAATITLEYKANDRKIPVCNGVKRSGKGDMYDMRLKRAGRPLAMGVPLMLMLALLLTGCGGPQAAQSGSSTEVNPNSDTPVNMIMAGASPEGYFRLIGESINSIVREEYTGSSIAYQPGSPAGSLALVAKGQAELAVAITPVEEIAAIEDEGPYEEVEEPLDGKFVSVMRLHEAQRMHSVMQRSFAEEYGIESFEDITEKQPPLRISINQQGNYQNIRIAEAIFESYGFTFDDIEEWGGEIFYQSSGGGIELLRDRSIDMYFNGTFIPDSSLADAERSLDLVWVGMDEDKLKEIADEFGLLTGTVQPGEYEFIEEQQPTIVWPSDMITNPDVPATDVYKVVKTVYENLGEMQAIHPEMKNFSGELMVKAREQVPLHPGAEQYYREQGLLDD